MLMLKLLSVRLDNIFVRGACVVGQWGQLPPSDFLQNGPASSPGAAPFRQRTRFPFLSYSLSTQYNILLRTILSSRTVSLRVREKASRIFGIDLSINSTLERQFQKLLRTKRMKSLFDMADIDSSIPSDFWKKCKDHAVLSGFSLADLKRGYYEKRRDGRAPGW